jgi:hypothetical protein
MALRFVYLAFCATLRLFALRRDEVEREAEPLVLPSRGCDPPSREGPAAASLVGPTVDAARARLLQPERRASLIVTPATLVRWHREFARMSPRWRTGNGANCTPEPPDLTAARRWPRHDRPSGPDRCARRAPHGQLARHRGPGARAVADPPSTAGSQSRLRRPGHLRSPI